MSESQLTSRIKKHLEQTFPDSWWVKVHGGPMQHGGLPDLLGCVAGRMVGLEVKLPEGKHPLTDLQAYTLGRIASAGGIGMVVRSVEEAEEIVGQVKESAVAP